MFAKRYCRYCPRTISKGAGSMCRHCYRTRAEVRRIFERLIKTYQLNRYTLRDWLT